MCGTGLRCVCVSWCIMDNNGLRYASCAGLLLYCMNHGLSRLKNAYHQTILNSYYILYKYGGHTKLW